MKVPLMGVDIDNLTMAETLNRVEEFIRTQRPHQHIVVNVNKVIKANKDQKFRDLINQCDLINVDGMPLVWASRMLNRPLKERVAGIDLFNNLLRVAEVKKYKLFLLGAKQDILMRVVDIINAKYPQVDIVGYRNGYWQDEEEIQIVNTIIEAKPDILFVAMSSPKKEYFINKHLKSMSIPFVMGVGGSFDVLAGKTKRAPRWMQKAGLEWFFRFLQEPGRLFKRYFVEGVNFISLIFKEIFRKKK